MRFNQQSLFVYEAEVFNVESLERLLTAPKLDSEGLKVGGIADFEELFLVVREYYSNYPLINFRELRTNTGENPVEVDDLWNEPADLKLLFNRTLKVRAKVAQQAQKHKQTKEGSEKTYDLQLYVGLPVLFDADYFPRPGDEFAYRGVVHTVSHVHVQPTDYFQHSSLPMHITIDSVIKQYDGVAPHQADKAALIGGLEESGRPSIAPPVSPDHDALTQSPHDDGF